MAFPHEIVIRDIPETESIRSRIERNVNKLPLFHPRIEYCHVAVDAAQKSKLQGKLFEVRLELGVPGKRLVVNHVKGENLYVTIRHAFAAMKRQLEQYSARQKNHVKHHPEPAKGVITKLFDNYGFIENELGEEFYFNATSLLHPEFETLEVGTEVNFLPTISDDGTQAMHVVGS